MAVRDFGRRKGEAGFTLIQIMVAVLVIGIVTTFATVRVLAARDHLRLTGAAREFASIMERARIDSVRRHENGGQATILINGANTYLAFMDHNYTGTPSWRTFSLPEGVEFSNIKVTQANGTVVPSASFPVSIAFNWRGLSATANRVTFQNTRGHTSFVSVTGAGEVSLDRNEISLLAGLYAAVTQPDSSALGPGVNSGGSTGISGGAPPPPPSPTATPTPSPTPVPTPTPQPTATPTPQPTATPTPQPSATPTPQPSATPTPQPTASPTPVATPTPPPPPCTMNVSPATLNLRNGGNNQPTTGVVTVTFDNPTANASFTYRENSTTPHLTLSASGNEITVRSQNGNGNRGAFILRVTPSAGCGSFKDVTVNVAQ